MYTHGSHSALPGHGLSVVLATMALTATALAGCIRPASWYDPPVPGRGGGSGAAAAGGAGGGSGAGSYPVGWQQEGAASWYGPGFHGRPTATGEIYDQDAVSAAHRDLPLGTVVKVENLDNGLELDLRINDRGPYVEGRIIDLSRAAAERLGVLLPGTAPVRVTVLQVGGDVVSTRGGCVYVQTGAFRSRDAADPMRRDAASAGWPVQVRRDGDWFLVLLGPIRDAATARTALNHAPQSFLVRCADIP